MPTNVLRAQSKRVRTATAVVADERIAVLRIGRCSVRIGLLQTPTADRIWQQLPLFSAAELWGECIHFEVPVETGRERTARLNVSIGDVCYWTEDDRVVIPFGPTPISRPDEIRLMRPCNIWGRGLDDLRQLANVEPAEKVTLERHSSGGGRTADR